MWPIKEEKLARKQLKKAPKRILKKYELWKNVMMFDGPSGIKKLKGFKDHTLYGEWKEARSSYLNDQWRVIYYVNNDSIEILLLEVNAHDYRKKSLKGSFTKSKRGVTLTVGESLKLLRELQGMSQSELASKTGIPQSTISGIENNRINLGVERVKNFARILKVHPAVILFPSWDTSKESQAS